MRKFECRRLGAFRYHILEDPRAIRRLLLKWVMLEWQQDHAQAPDQPWTVQWMERLPGMRFSLKQVKLAEIRPREDLMNHEVPGYSFIAELESRLQEREMAVHRGCSIEPLLIDGQSMELMDGYVRYTLLRRHRQRLVYAYVGVQTKPRGRRVRSGADDQEAGRWTR